MKSKNKSEKKIESQLKIDFNKKASMEGKVVSINRFGDFTPSKISIREQIINRTKSF